MKIGRVQRSSPIASLFLLAACSSSGPFPSQLSNLSTPKTLLDRTIEARSADDIAKDTSVFLDANSIMLEHGALALTTEVYEQRLIVSGPLNSPEKCDPVRAALQGIDGLKALYWHVLCVTKEEQRATGAIGEFRRAILRAKANMRLFGAEGVADVNLRVAVDSQRNAIVLGRARSDQEKAAALTAVTDEGIRQVVDHIEVRP